MLLARALLDSGRNAEARTMLSGLVAAGEDNALVRRNLAVALLRQGEYAEAEPLASGLVKEARGAELAPALFFLAHALWGCGRVEESRQIVARYREAMENEKEDSKQP